MKKRVKKYTGMTPQQIREKNYVDVFACVRDAMLLAVEAAVQGDTANLADVAQNYTEKILSL